MYLNYKMDLDNIPSEYVENEDTLRSASPDIDVTPTVKSPLIEKEHEKEPDQKEPDQKELDKKEKKVKVSRVELVERFNTYLNKANDETEDLHSRIVNYSLVANLLLTLGEKVSKKLFKNHDYTNLYNHVSTKLILLKNQLSSHKMAMTKETYNMISYTPESLFENHNKTFAGIIGLESAKETLQDVIIKPRVYNTLYGDGVRTLLIYGPSQTGKTELVKATLLQLMRESCERDQPLLIRLYTPYGGDLKATSLSSSERQIQALFDFVTKETTKFSDYTTYNVIFLDDLHTIDHTDTSVMKTLISCMRRLTKNTLFIAATNVDIKTLPQPLIKCFEKHVLTRLPTETEIRRYLDIKLSELVRRTIEVKTSSDLQLYDNSQDYTLRVNDHLESQLLHEKDWIQYSHYMSLNDTYLAGLARHLCVKGSSFGDINELFDRIRRHLGSKAFTRNLFIQETFDNKHYWLALLKNPLEQTAPKKRMTTLKVNYMNGKPHANILKVTNSKNNGSKVVEDIVYTHTSVMTTGNVPVSLYKNVNIYYTSDNVGTNTLIFIDMKIYMNSQSKPIRILVKCNYEESKEILNYIERTSPSLSKQNQETALTVVGNMISRHTLYVRASDVSNTGMDTVYYALSSGTFSSRLRDSIDRGQYDITANEDSLAHDLKDTVILNELESDRDNFELLHTQDKPVILNVTCELFNVSLAH
jgi:DNA replication protein DnaC